MVTTSPALSVCDSLADIEDLDAFLAGKGALSRFPTPPLPYSPLSIASSSSPSSVYNDVAFCDDVDYFGLAVLFSDVSITGRFPAPGEIHLVNGILSRANLSTVLLAMAYSVISNRPDTTPHPPDLLLLAALKLTLAFSSDSPPSTAWWSRHAAAGTWTASRIDAAAIELFTAWDWSLLPCFQPSWIDAAYVKLGVSYADSPGQPLSQAGPTAIIPTLLPLQPPPAAFSSLKVNIGAGDACWSHGQLTPDDIPECSLFEKAVIGDAHQESDGPIQTLSSSYMQSQGSILDGTFTAQSGSRLVH